MIRRFYSRVTAGRHRLAVIAVGLAFGCLVACGSRATPTSAEPQASTSVQALLDQAQEAERARDYHRARALYQRAIDEAPDAGSSALANREMASALIFWGEYEGGEALLRQSLAHDASQARVWHDLALVQARGDRPKEALASLEKALTLAPDEPRVVVAYAALLVKETRFADAIAQYEHLLQLEIPPRIETATRKALVMLRSEIERNR